MVMNPSLCIPRLNPNCNKVLLQNRFNELDIGNIKQIDIIFKNNEKGERFYSAFIHISWNKSELSKYIIDRITSGKDIKIVYDGFMFWKVLLNKSTRNNTVREDIWERNSKL